LIELSSHFRRVTLQVISQIALGFDPDQANIFPALFEAVLDELNQRPYKPWRSWLPHIEIPHRAKLAEINKIVDLIIAQRRSEKPAPITGKTTSQENTEVNKNEDISDIGGSSADTGVSVTGIEIFKDGRGDMLDMILENGANLSDNDIRDELKTQLLAGHETSSMLLTWSCYLIAAYPECAKRVQEEIDTELGTNPNPPFEAFRKLSYLDCVLKEAMRVYTPVPILNRTCIEADDLAGYPITPGAGIIVSVWSLHNSPALWGSDVDKFRPERFLPEESKSRHPWAYMPFSLGERNCIGQNLAMLEAKVVLATFLQRFDITLPKGQSHPETDSFIIPVRPHARLCLIAKERAIWRENNK
jgi:cytochrome P450